MPTVETRHGAAQALVSASQTVVTQTIGRPASTPYLGVTPQLPGVLNAVSFDDGGASVAYYDRSSGNAGGAFRTGDVDIEQSSEGGYNIGWTSAGEWLRYNVNVAVRGTYRLHMRVASAGRGGTLHLESDGVDLTGPLPVP
ncbi:MAG: carbohydrate-binding protein, partial [Vicinamibacterales bacterium]